MPEEDLETSLRSWSTAELLAVLRKGDTDEWRPEVFGVARALLVERGIDVDRALAENPPNPAPAAHPSEVQPVASSGLQPIATFPTIVDAEPCRSALSAAGFDVSVVDENMIAIDPILWRVLGGLKLAVPADQVDEAREFLEAVERGDFASAPEVAIQCSACGSPRVRYVSRTDRASTLSTANPESAYVCDDCGAIE
jgi:hypothetical protein